MRYRLVASVLLISASLIFSAAFVPQTSADKPSQATTQKDSAKFDPRNLSGVWDTQHPGGFKPGTPTFFGEIPPMTPWGQTQFLATRPSIGPRAVPDSTDPVYPTKLGVPGCFPPGVPRIYLHALPMEILQVPGRIFMRFELDHNLREIWMDGRSHPKDPNPSYMGNSIGTWEGNTLVVDTIGFNDKTWLDREGHRHSEELHLIERLQRVNAHTLQDDMTIIDPKTFTKPWKTQITFELRPDWEILEHTCADSGNFDNVLKMQGQGK
jgi:hypothetical protein